MAACVALCPTWLFGCSDDHQQQKMSLADHFCGSDVGETLQKGEIKWTTLNSKYKVGQKTEHLYKNLCESKHSRIEKVPANTQKDDIVVFAVCGRMYIDDFGDWGYSPPTHRSKRGDFTHGAQSVSVPWKRTSAHVGWRHTGNSSFPGFYGWQPKNTSCEDSTQHFLATEEKNGTKKCVFPTFFLSKKRT